MTLLSQFISSLILLASPSLWAAEYIVGGQSVQRRDPIRASTVGIYGPSADGRSGSLCTGTLIGKNMAVTAAHCIQSGSPSPVVIFGNDLHDPTSVHRKAQAVAVNKKWPASSKAKMDQGDIALVKFPGGIPKGFQEVPQIASAQDIQKSKKVTLAGYGIADAKTHTGAGRLRKTQVDVLSTRPGKSEMILDQSKGHGACHGDSGGPAYIRRKGKLSLAGVTNRGYPNNSPDDCAHQVVYTKVPSYRSWIQKSVQKLNSSPDSQEPQYMSAKTHLTRSALLAKRLRPRRHSASKQAHPKSRKRKIYQARN